MNYKQKKIILFCSVVSLNAMEDGLTSYNKKRPAPIIRPSSELLPFLENNGKNTFSDLGHSAKKRKQEVENDDSNNSSIQSLLSIQHPRDKFLERLSRQKQRLMQELYQVSTKDMLEKKINDILEIEYKIIKTHNQTSKFDEANQRSMVMDAIKQPELLKNHAAAQHWEIVEYLVKDSFGELCIPQEISKFLELMDVPENILFHTTLGYALKAKKTDIVHKILHFIETYLNINLEMVRNRQQLLQINQLNTLASNETLAIEVDGCLKKWQELNCLQNSCYSQQREQLIREYKTKYLRAKAELLEKEQQVMMQNVINSIKIHLIQQNISVYEDFLCKKTLFKECLYTLIKDNLPSCLYTMPTFLLRDELMVDITRIHSKLIP